MIEAGYVPDQDEAREALKRASRGDLNGYQTIAVSDEINDVFRRVISSMTIREQDYEDLRRAIITYGFEQKIMEDNDGEWPEEDEDLDGPAWDAAALEASVEPPAEEDFRDSDASEETEETESEETENITDSSLEEGTEDSVRDN